MTKAASFVGAAFCLSAEIFILLTRSGGYEFLLREARLMYTRPAAEIRLEGVVLLLFRAHGKKCRSDDHSEKYQCKNKIVDHWGVSFLWAALAVFE
jgi:hypothetical protein